MTQDDGSRANEIMQYSFLVAFANDGTLDEWEIDFMKNLALEDGKIDDAEKRTFQQIFSRISEDAVSAETWDEIQKFRREFEI